MSYAELLPTDATPLEALELNQQETLELLEAWPTDRTHYAYAPGKWTVAQVVQHLIDAERIFQYRALCFARGDQTALPGFDHDAYAEASPATGRSLSGLIGEWAAVRTSSQAMFASFSDEQLARTGFANGKPVGVGELGLLIAGHTRHHLQVLAERYRG